MVLPALRRRRVLAGTGAVAATALLAAAVVTPASDASPATAGTTAAAAHRMFKQVNLVSDVPGLARMTDPLMSNPWGVAMGPETPIWINNEGSATSEVFAGANGVDPISLRLTVQTPSHPTAIATNFERRDGYLGMALVQTRKGARMLAVSFQGRIDVFNGRFKELSGK